MNLVAEMNLKSTLITKIAHMYNTYVNTYAYRYTMHCIYVKLFIYAHIWIRMYV